MSSRMRSSSYLKPPLLPKSPISLQSRQVLLSNSSSTRQTPPPGVTKPGRRVSHGDVEIEYSSAFAKMVETEFAQEEEDDPRTREAAASKLERMAANSAPVLERGRFYNEYSAKRNERLKRKRVVVGGDGDSVVKGTPYSLGVEPMTTKRTGKKKTVETTATKPPRYSLRSMTKENKKPPLPLPINVAVTSAKKISVTTTTTIRGRRI